MIKEVASLKLPAAENWVIRKNRLIPPHADPSLAGLKRFCVVTGIHGDELEGQYVCYELNRRLQEHPEFLKGIVDIYPAANPLGIDTLQRGIPLFDLDMNRIFPGSDHGAVAEWVAHRLIEDIRGADAAVDLHASNIFLREIPQCRININTADELIPLAKYLDVDFIWVHQAVTVLESTLAYSLNSIGVKTLVVEEGVGMRITREYGERLVNGILCLLKHLGIWDGPVDKVREPIVSVDRAVSFINAEASGVFIPESRHSQMVKRGESVGEIVDPLSGKVLENCTAPSDGLLFTLREYPIVNEGSLIARILEEAK
ncbi:MAG: M14 family metallopeptidase [Succinivibrio sp.]|nr:M14 family metallopeptidase [Succinivibrio sp.]